MTSAAGSPITGARKFTPKGLTQAGWQELLQRWVPMDVLSAEARLACAVLAAAIADEVHTAADEGRALFSRTAASAWFFAHGGFAAWCGSVGINPQFVMERVLEERAYVATGRRIVVKTFRAEAKEAARAARFNLDRARRRSRQRAVRSVEQQP